MRLPIKLLAISFLFVTVLTKADSLPELTNILNQSHSLDWQDSLTAEVTIHAPIEEVWKYASDSLQAKNWSIFFDHIAPLAGTESDGNPGSVRRCFRNANESGPSWDEMVIEVNPLVSRSLYVYNLIGFFPDFFSKLSHYYRKY